MIFSFAYRCLFGPCAPHHIWGHFLRFLRVFRLDYLCGHRIFVANIVRVCFKSLALLRIVRLHRFAVLLFFATIMGLLVSFFRFLFYYDVMITEVLHLWIRSRDGASLIGSRLLSSSKGNGE